MTRNTIRVITLALGGLAVLATASGARAQTVSVANSRLSILDTDGDSAILVTNGGDYSAGGNGRTAVVSLRTSDGLGTFFYQAFQAQLVLGAGAHEGIVLLKDDDGVTTTIELDGRIGGARLGGNGVSGDLLIHDNTDTETFGVEGQTGTATNQFSANGQVKAWARIAADGSVLSCWRCNPAATSRVGTPTLYTVDFSPLASDIQSRPRMAVLDSHASTVEGPGAVRLLNATTATGVLVWTTMFDPAADEPGFTIFIY